MVGHMINVGGVIPGPGLKGAKPLFYGARGLRPLGRSQRPLRTRRWRARWLPRRPHVYEVGKPLGSRSSSRSEPASKRP